MRIGIELSSYTSVHAGGKDQSTYNLLKGLISIHHENDIICICYEDLRQTIEKLFPDIKVRVLPYQKRIHIINNLDRGYAIKRIIKDENLDLVYFTNKFGPKMKFKVPTVLIAHDVQVFIPELARVLCKSKIFEIKLKILIYMDFYFRTKVLAISEDDKRNMLEHIPFAKKKVHVVKNPIQFGNTDRRTCSPCYITALNIQMEHKNVFTLIKAFCSIADKIDYDLICVGKVPENYSEIQEYVRKSGYRDRIHFTGFVTDEELHEIVNKTRVYCNPSLYEGFGMTAVEMMGNGIPTIVADNSAQKEITLGLCRYYTPTTDSDALAKTIMEEIDNPTLPENLEKIAATIRSTYNYEKVAEEIWEYLESVYEEYS